MATSKKTDHYQRDYSQLPTHILQSLFLATYRQHEHVTAIACSSKQINFLYSSLEAMSTELGQRDG